MSAATIPPPPPSARRSPPTAATAVRRSRRRLAAALKFSAATIVTAVLVAAFGLWLFLRRGDVLAARRSAAAELALLLEPGERVEREAFVSQRRWYHYFREMHGILAATDRRLLYVGVEPPPLLPRREYEPQSFEEHAYTWDTLTTVRRRRVYFNTARGAIVAGREGRQEIAVSGPQRQRLDALVTLVDARRNATIAAIERERQARIAAEFEARKPKFHKVQPGEALFTIAQMYNTTPEQLRAWNNLASDKIKAGQVLMVKPQT